MNVFLTGGSSPLGDVLVPKLAESHSVLALVRSEAAADRVANGGAKAIMGSIEEWRSWAPWAHRADAVVHLAGIANVPAVLAGTVEGQPLTVMSSASVLDPDHPRSGALAAREQELLERRGSALVVLRPTMIYGSPRDRNVRYLARLISKAPLVPRFTGGGHIQPVFADDVADAVVTNLGVEDCVFAALGGPDVIQFGVLVETLARLLSKPVLKVPVPVALVSHLARTAGRVRMSRGVHALEMLSHDRVVGPPERRLVGRPLTPLAEGVAQALTRYQAG